MAAPVAPLQVCLLVSYPMGFANPANTPNIGVYALVDGGDALTSGIKMRVERCTGSGCSSFAFRGNSSGVQYPSGPDPQAEFIDTGAYGTIYRYRVRMENDDGVSSYSATVEIDTTIHGASACDSGSIVDFSDEVRATGGRTMIEYDPGDSVQATGQRSATEWDLSQVQNTGLRNQQEYLLSQVQITGLRIIYEWIETNAVDLRVTKTSDNPTPFVGEEVVWTITVENVSTNDATDVVVNDVLPSGVFFVGYVASVGTFDPIAGIWTIGTLLAGATATLDVTVLAGIIPGAVTNTAIATSTEPDSNPGDNEDDDTIVIQTTPPPVEPCIPDNPPPVPPLPPGECPPRTPPDTLNYSVPFRLYKKDFEVRAKSWGDPGAYAILRPMGGPSYEDGAAI